MDLGRCLGNKLVVAVALDFAEQDVGVGDRAQRIQRDAGGRIRGDLFNTIDVDLDRAVVRARARSGQVQRYSESSIFS